MMNLIGDMYRQSTVLTTPSVPSGATVRPYRTWINYPANILNLGTEVYRMEFGGNLDIKLQGFTFDHLTAPEDAEPLPATLEFKFIGNLEATVDALISMFETNYGRPHHIYSEAHHMFFVGTIPFWEKEHHKGCESNLTVAMDVKDMTSI